MGLCAGYSASDMPVAGTRRLITQAFTAPSRIITPCCLNNDETTRKHPCQIAFSEVTMAICFFHPYHAKDVHEDFLEIIGKFI